MKSAKFFAAILVVLFAVVVLSGKTASALATENITCTGVADEGLFYAAMMLDSDVVINVTGDCVFSDALNVGYWYVDSLVINGNGSVFSPDGAYNDGALMNVMGVDLTINDVTMMQGGLDLVNLYHAIIGVGDTGAPTTVNLQNVTIDGFMAGIAIVSEGGAEFVLNAEGLVIINTKPIVADGTFGLIGDSVSAAIAVVRFDSVPTEAIVNWTRGRSDADYATVTFDGSGISINGEEVSGFAPSGLTHIGWMDYLGSNNAVNKLVNCGFPVGSQWDICADEETSGGGLGAPNTGIFENGSLIGIFAALSSVSVIGFIAGKRFA